jgi:hypothetical protein
MEILIAGVIGAVLSLLLWVPPERQRDWKAPGNLLAIAIVSAGVILALLL